MKIRKPSRKRVIRTLLFSAIGTACGFAYYYFIGCRTGSCPITSDPALSMIYGSAMGLLLSF